MAHELSCPWHVGSSGTRDLSVSLVSRVILNHGTTREVLSYIVIQVVLVCKLLFATAISPSFFAGS